MKYVIKKEWSSIFRRMRYYAYDEDGYIEDTDGDTLEECELQLRKTPLGVKEKPTVVKELEI